MNRQYGRTLQDTVTTLGAAEVLAQAKRFFSTRQGIYAAFPEKEGPTFVNLRGQGGEEVVIGVAPDARGTRVTGSTYLFDMQVARFLGSLPPGARSRARAGRPGRGAARRRAGRADERRRSAGGRHPGAAARRGRGRRRPPRRLARLTRPAAA
jgi:hypothetical protein